MIARRNLLVLVAFMMLGLIVAACGAPAPAATPQTIVVTSPPVIQTVVVTAAPQAQPTAAPAAVKPVTVLSLWGGSEQAAFQKVLDGFTKKTNIPVQYEQARDFVPILRTRLAAGNPPNVAIIPRPGIMADLAKQGALIPLQGIVGKEVISPDDMKASYAKAWQDLGSADGTLYGIVVKANSKSTVWYKPASFKALGVDVPKKWDDLIAISDKYVAGGKTPWAVGGKDSWTLTDWFENIYVRSAGPDKYSQLFGGKLPFTDSSVVDAAKRMTQIISNAKYVSGGIDGVLGTAFVPGIGLVFGTNAKAEMYMEGGFVGGIALGEVNKALKPGEDIAFFPFPTIDDKIGSPVVGGGDLAVMFTDNPQVRELVKYLASKEAGEIWSATGAIVSPNKLVDLKAYPNVLTKAEAEQVAGATAFRFDGSDLLPGSLGDDWGTALQDMVAKPANIEAILKDFETKAKVEFKR